MAGNDDPDETEEGPRAMQETVRRLGKPPLWSEVGRRAFGLPRSTSANDPPQPSRSTTDSPLDTETVLKNTDRSGYGYRANQAATQSESSAGKTPGAEKPGTKTLDYLALGLLLAPPAVVFEIFIKDESINWRRTAFATAVSWAAGSIVVWASHGWQSWQAPSWRIWPYLVAAEGKFWGRALIVAASIGLALALSSGLSEKAANTYRAAGFTQQQVDEKISAATAPIQSRLDAANATVTQLQAKITAHSQQSPDANLKAQLDNAIRERDAAASQAAGLQQKLAIVTGERNDAKRALFIARADAAPKSLSPSSFASYSLTEDQIHKIADEVYQIQSLLPKTIQIDRIMYNGDSMGLGGQIGRALDLGGIVPGLSWNRPQTPRDTGLRIRVPDLASKSPGAEKIAQILKEITGVEAPFEASDGLNQPFVIFVGPKP